MTISWAIFIAMPVFAVAWLVFLFLISPLLGVPRSDFVKAVRDFLIR